MKVWLPAIGRSVACMAVTCVASAAPISLFSPNAQTNDLFGYRVATMGDVSGDGIADIAVSAPNESTPDQTGFGRVYVFSGANGALVRTVNSASPATHGAFGYALAAVPDANNDGVTDLLIGAPAERVRGDNLGRVHLHNGANGARIRSFDGIDDGLLSGRSFEFGATVAVYGDANGDEVTDFVIGAPGWFIADFEPGGGFLTPGRAYLIDGEDGGRLREFIAPNRRDEGMFGAAVAVIDDITGDGESEVAVGAPADRDGQIRPGRVYVFNGATGAQLYSLSSRNPINSGRFGANLARIEDLNNDGFADIVVSADNERTAGFESVGRVYVYSGATGVHLLTVTSPNPESLMFFGTALGTISDYNGDGRVDLVVTAGTGARLKQPVQVPIRAFIVNSVTGAIIHRIAIHDSAGAPLFGSAVTAIGDVDGDGRDDVVVGSSFGQGGFASRAYIARSRDFAGGAIPPPSFECHGRSDGTAHGIDILGFAVMGVLLATYATRTRRAGATGRA